MAIPIQIESDDLITCIQTGLKASSVEDKDVVLRKLHQLTLDAIQRVTKQDNSYLSKVRTSLFKKENFMFTKMGSINDSYIIKFRFYKNFDNELKFQLYEKRRYGDSNWELIGEQNLDFEKTRSGIFVLNYTATFSWSDFHLYFDPSTTVMKVMWKADIGTVQIFELDLEK